MPVPGHVFWALFGLRKREIDLRERDRERQRERDTHSERGRYFCVRQRIEQYEGKIWAVVVFKWSACSPSTPTIRVRIPLRSTIFL